MREGGTVTEIHCHLCGGVIHDPTTIEHRPPRASAQLALTHPGPCTCTPPVHYDDPPVLEAPPEDASPENAP